MKKNIIIILVLLMLFSFTGCSNTNEEYTKEESLKVSEKAFDYVLEDLEEYCKIMRCDYKILDDIEAEQIKEEDILIIIKTIVSSELLRCYQSRDYYIHANKDNVEIVNINSSEFVDY